MLGTLPGDTGGQFCGWGDSHLHPWDIWGQALCVAVSEEGQGK